MTGRTAAPWSPDPDAEEGLRVRFGENVRLLRARAHISQEELASAGRPQPRRELRPAGAEGQGADRGDLPVVVPVDAEVPWEGAPDPSVDNIPRLRRGSSVGRARD
jgi:hypothetical protein